MKVKDAPLNPGTAFLFSFVAVSVTVLVALIESASPARMLTLFLGFEGTALLASVLLNTLLVPPDGSDLWEWMFVPQIKTLGVVLRQPLFYLGLICLLLQDSVARF